MLTMALMGCSGSSQEKTENTVENKAKSIIEDKLKKNMNDWDSYEFVEMSKLDSTYTSFSHTDTYKLLRNKKTAIENKISDFKINSDYPLVYGRKRCKAMKDSIGILENNLNVISDSISYLDSSFKKEHDGWVCVFTYRGKNGFGAMTIGKTRFFLNKDLSEIVHSFTIK